MEGIQMLNFVDTHAEAISGQLLNWLLAIKLSTILDNCQWSRQYHKYLYVGGVVGRHKVVDKSSAEIEMAKWHHFQLHISYKATKSMAD